MMGPFKPNLTVSKRVFAVLLDSLHSFCAMRVYRKRHVQKFSLLDSAFSVLEFFKTASYWFKG